MMIKIDAKEFACAAHTMREAEFPVNKYKELGVLKPNIDKLVNLYTRKNQIITMPFDTGHVECQTNFCTPQFKEKKIFGKTIKVPVSKITIALDNHLFSFHTAGNPKRLFLFVADRDVPKFDVIVSKSMNTEQEIFDMAQFVTAYGVFVYNFVLVL